MTPKTPNMKYPLITYNLFQRVPHTSAD